MKTQTSLNGQAKSHAKVQINSVESTYDNLSSRAGLALIMKYIEQTGILSRLSYKFQHFNRNSNGLQVPDFMKQIIACMIDGSKLDLVVFDDLKQDAAYAILIESEFSDLASSHQIKRMFAKFQNNTRHTCIFRDIQTDIFISHLRSTQPPVVVLGVDTMVMDNDQASQREGCSPTYKKVKGFQPLQFYWNGMIIDSIFREGKCHSNHGDDVKNSVQKLVKKIRKGYSETVPIILKMDSGFMSEENFQYFEELGILYISAGRMYSSIKDYIGELPVANRNEYVGTKQTWDYIEFGNKLDSWDKFRRAIYLQQTSTDTGQLVLDFAKSDRIIYTNIGINTELSAIAAKALGKDICCPRYIIKEFHNRAQDELCNRGFKDFVARENLPFKGFAQNQAFYYLLAISMQLLQSYVRDICFDVFSSKSYPTTMRRQLIDFAGKFVSHSRKITLKVSALVFKQYKINLLWERCLYHKRKIAYI